MVLFIVLRKVQPVSLWAEDYCFGAQYCLQTQLLSLPEVPESAKQYSRPHKETGGMFLVMKV